ncbi:MAG: hypothetical protein ACRC1D_07975 [Culicoidibacterales bacterium]
MAQKADNTDGLKVIKTTETFHFQIKNEMVTHNDLAIADDEFFTSDFMLAATNGIHSTLHSLLQQQSVTLEQIIQTTTEYPDFESFKMAAFAAYLEQQFHKHD